MTIYKCDICNITTKLKSNYTQHLNTIKHKNKLLEQVHKNKNYGDEHKMSTDEHKMSTNEHKKNTEHSCEFCYSYFTTKANKRRHELHYCDKAPIDYKELYKKSEKEKNELKKNMEKEKEELKKNIAKERTEMKQQMDKLYDQISRLIDKAGDTNVTNIILNNYGHEDLSHITDSFKTSLLKIPYAAIPKMIEAVHFSNKKPENKNIALTNMKDNKIRVYRDGKWVFQNKQDTINDLVFNNYDIIDSHYENNSEQISEIANNNYLNFQKKLDERDINTIKEQTSDCELLLLNNR